MGSLRAPWVSRPWVDLLVGCGGWSLPLLLLSWQLVDADARRWAALFYTLALACNYPHYMATIHRAYFRRGDRDRHRLVTHYLTAALVLVGVVAHVRPGLLPWLFTAYVLWSPWHYTGQNYGLTMMFLRRAGIEVSESQRRRLRVAFIASYVLLLVAFNEAGARDPLVLSLNLPSGVSFPLEAAAAVMCFALLLPALGGLIRRNGWRAMTPALTLVLTQTLWFVAPIVLTWTGVVSIVQTRYSSGILAVMHSAQYLWITQHYARRDAALHSGKAAWSGWRYWATLVAGGIALFVPGPWLASALGHVDLTSSMLIVTSIVNLHHFIVDGVVWKLRDSRVSSVLVQQGGASPDGAKPQAAGASRHVWALQAVAALALVALAVVDQWRYRLAIPGSDTASLSLARRLNPWDTPVHLGLAAAGLRGDDGGAAEQELRTAIAAPSAPMASFTALARVLVEQQRLEAAYDVVRASLERWPTDVDALVNAGVLASRLEHPEEAAVWWRRALSQDDRLRQVHLYLAELLDGSGSGDAIPHYRRYLELLLEDPAAAQQAPREVALVAIKFGDALARAGRLSEAQGQFGLASAIASRAGLPDVAALARARLSPAE